MIPPNRRVSLSRRSPGLKIPSTVPSIIVSPDVRTSSVTFLDTTEGKESAEKHPDQLLKDAAILMNAQVTFHFYNTSIKEALSLSDNYSWRLKARWIPSEGLCTRGYVCIDSLFSIKIILKVPTQSAELL